MSCVTLRFGSQTINTRLFENNVRQDACISIDVVVILVQKKNQHVSNTPNQRRSPNFGRPTRPGFGKVDDWGGETTPKRNHGLAKYQWFGGVAWFFDHAHMHEREF